jgi:hypothetical protein
MYNYSSIFRYEWLKENIEIILLSFLSLVIPITFSHSQIITGILVNTVLVVAALRLKFYQALPVILLPSIGALASGFIFGPFTVFLIYMIPFIWIGNTILVLTYKKINNKIFALIFSSALKALFLFSMALLLYKLNIIPVIFLTTMGVLQLITALAGGIITLGILKIFSKHKV